MTDAFGNVTWWGFSPALDLQDEDEISALKNLKITANTQDELNILLVGAGDLRHALLTIARSYRHHKRKLNFYIIENCLELYARDMLFVSIALEQPHIMGLQEKTELYLELLGNILVRRQTADYVQKAANEFIKMVTDPKYLDKKLPVVDLSLLKYKERDFLESILKFWRNPDVKLFDATLCWDLRQRKHLGVRYDSRKNVYDWDYQMRHVQRDADIINSYEYKNWRDTGVAFEVREADYEIPNKTLASGLVFTVEGEKHARRGYWGDIVVSPYVSIGITCEDESFFKKSNKMFVNTASQIAEFNVLSMLHEIATRTPYIKPEPEPVPQKQSPRITEVIEEEEEKEEGEEKAEKKKEELLKEYDEDLKESLEGQTDDKTQQEKSIEEEYYPLPLDDVKIRFLPLASVGELKKKSKYQKLFHIVYFSNSMVHLLNKDVTPVLADKASVITETARYMLELKLEQVKQFVTKVEGLAREAGCKVVEKCDPEKANCLKFAFERDDAVAS